MHQGIVKKTKHSTRRTENNRAHPLTGRSLSYSPQGVRQPWGCLGVPLQALSPHSQVSGLDGAGGLGGIGRVDVGSPISAWVLSNHSPIQLY